MALEAKGWNSEHISLKPFTYLVPETRFIHAGLNVYKFKIKYGNTVSTNIDLHEDIANKELEEAIRVVLGNLNNLHPFTTEHLVIFPYLSKWEKASDLRFKCGDTFLFPYPYVCIVYTEINSRQKCLFLGKTEYRDACNFADTTSELSMYRDTGRAMKWSRQECTAEISHVKPYNYRCKKHWHSMGPLDLQHQLAQPHLMYLSKSYQPARINVAGDSTYIYGTARPYIGGTRLQKDVIHLTENLPEEMQLQYCRGAIVNNGYDNMTVEEHVEYDVAENSGHDQRDGQVLILPQQPEEHTEWKKRGFLALLKSILFPPVLQCIFSRISQPS